MNYGLVAEQVKQYATSYLTANSKSRLLYHDHKHTETVVAAVKQISAHYQLNEEDHFIVLAAAWFHDLAYCMSGAGKMHELKSAELAGEFLKEKGVSDATNTAIKNCILATKLPQHPITLQEQIVCDADLYNLGTDDFRKRNKLMRKEFEATTNTHISKEEWRKGTIQLFQGHQYHTEYCRNLLNKKKQENLEKLLLKEEDNDATQPEVSEALKQKLDTPKEKALVESKPTSEDLPVKKEERPVRGIETMFRIAVTNHQRLSDMADSKANIMISVNSIIISVVIALVVRKLEATPILIIPTMIFLAGCVTATIFSVLATRPKIPDGYFTPEQLSNKTVNLLFFGNFY
ncbi:MAG: Pycsar system effector family protein, partial [Ferruginibacter sp.]